MMKLIKLNNTDDRPIFFYGEEIAYETDKEDEGDRSIRWTNVRVYLRDKGDYIVGIARLTCFIGERDYLASEQQLKTIKEVITFIQKQVSTPFEFIDKKNGHKVVWLACPNVANSIAIQLNERKRVAVGK